MLDLTRKLPSLTVPPERQDHDWKVYASPKDQGTFGRKAHRLCRRCGVVCRPDNEYAPCDIEPKRDIKS